MALALFDLDDTLIDGDCASLWGQQMRRLGWVDDAFMACEQQLMEQYAQGLLAMEDYMGFSLQPLRGRPASAVASSVADFVEQQIAPVVHADARDCLARHRAAGDRLLIISASADFLVSAIGRLLGVDEVLAIDCQLHDGHYSGQTQGILTYREGKVQRLQAWLDQQQLGLDGAYFYSDSRNDLPLLSLVERPHTVNPDPHLRQHAEVNGWPILDWN